MTISELIALLGEEMEENGDSLISIYDSSGDFIEPKGFSYGARSTSDGWINTVSFTDLE